MLGRLDPHDIAAALGIPESALGDPTHGVGWDRLLDYIADHNDAAEAARTAHSLDPRWICDGKLRVRKVPGWLWVLECPCGRPLAQALQYVTILGFCSESLQRRSYRWREENRCGQCGGRTSGAQRCVHSWGRVFMLNPDTQDPATRAAVERIDARRAAESSWQLPPGAVVTKTTSWEAAT